MIICCIPSQVQKGHTFRRHCKGNSTYEILNHEADGKRILSRCVCFSSITR